MDSRRTELVTLPSNVIHSPELRDLKFYDSLQIPTIYDNRIDAYKEWHHFNLFDDKNNLFVLFNFAITGNVFNAKSGIITKTALIRDPAGRFLFAVEPQSSESLKVSHLKPDMAFGSNASVTYEDMVYHVSLDMETIPVRANLRFHVISTPIYAPTRPFGSGYIGWTAVPRLDACGSIEIEGREYVVQDSAAYHDHDWGQFYWGEQIGWEWGIFSEAKNTGITIVIDQRTTGMRGMVHEKFLFIYKGGKLLRVFTGSDLKIELIGKYRGKKAVTPGLMRILHPETSSATPDRFVIEGRLSRSEKITIKFRPKNVIQIIVPNQSGKGETQLNQIIGDIEVASSIKEIEISEKLNGYLESVGPI
jgi:hypothetical protein